MREKKIDIFFDFCIIYRARRCLCAAVLEGEKTGAEKKENGGDISHDGGERERDGLAFQKIGKSF